MNLTEQKLIEFIKDCTETKAKIKPHTPLFSTSLLDSICMLDIVMFIEENENIKFQNNEINLKNFDTISRILSCIKNKLSSDAD